MTYFVRRVSPTADSAIPDPNVSFEFQTMHLPFLLATDETLQRHVEARLRETYVGRRMMEGQPIEKEMSELAIEAIVEKYPVKGLREALLAYHSLDMGDLLDEKDRPNLAQPKKELPQLKVVEMSEVLP